MDKSIATTYTFNRCCINFFPDGDAHFHDYTSDETIHLEGIDVKELQQAIKRFVHNIAINPSQSAATKEWLEEIREQAIASIEMLEAETNE